MIILTSNIGTQKISSSKIGFVDEKETVKNHNLTKEIEKYFKAEFLNRIDDLIVFNSLSENDLYKIMDIQLNDLRNNLKKKNMRLRVNQSAKKVLLQNGSHREWGARPIRRIIQSDIENIISFKFLNGELTENSTIIINGKNTELLFTSKKNTTIKKTHKKTIPSKIN